MAERVVLVEGSWSDATLSDFSTVADLVTAISLERAM